MSWRRSLFHATLVRVKEDVLSSTGVIAFVFLVVVLVGLSSIYMRLKLTELLLVLSGLGVLWLSVSVVGTIATVVLAFVRALASLHSADERRVVTEEERRNIYRAIRVLSDRQERHWESVLRVLKMQEAASQRRNTLVIDSIGLMPVIGSIPAGRARLSTDDIQDVVVGLDQMIIGDVRYYLKHLYGRRVIMLDRSEYDYYLSPVAGDSMNLADIEDGDYVILRRPRNLPLSPSPGDIVAASIIGVDREATLKRYLRHGHTIILSPDSSNPYHQPYEFREDDPEVEIAAVAVAVLKPMLRLGRPYEEGEVQYSEGEHGEIGSSSSTCT